MNTELQQSVDLAEQLNHEPLSTLDSLGSTQSEAMYDAVQRVRNPDKANVSYLWYTTNSEYGRFQNARKMSGKRNGSGVSLHGEGVHETSPASRHGSLLSGSAAGRPASQIVSDARARVEQENDLFERQASKRSTAAVRLTPLAETTRDVPEVPPREEFPAVAAPFGQTSPRKRLTTGVAKAYVQQSCGRLWDNLQTVAEGAGFDTKPRSRAASDAQVLTIDYNNDDVADDQDAVSRSSRASSRLSFLSQGI